jgi:hypothetical protein
MRFYSRNSCLLFLHGEIHEIEVFSFLIYLLSYSIGDVTPRGSPLSPNKHNNAFHIIPCFGLFRLLSRYE